MKPSDLVLHVLTYDGENWIHQIWKLRHCQTTDIVRRQTLSDVQLLLYLQLCIDAGVVKLRKAFL